MNTYRIEYIDHHGTTMKPGTTYDYQTRWFPGETRVSLEDDKKVVGFGWNRVWADITEAGTFVVYRKTVWEKESDLIG